jgi:hypothetical protein
MEEARSVRAEIQFGTRLRACPILGINAANLFLE